MKNEKKLTAKDRLEAEAKAAALSAEARTIRRHLKADAAETAPVAPVAEATTAAREATDMDSIFKESLASLSVPAEAAPAEEVAPVVTPVEAPAEEVAPVVTPAEAPAEEVAPVVTPVEAPAEEVAPVVTPVEAPAEEVAPVVTPVEAPAEEVAPVVTPVEAPAEEVSPVVTPAAAPAEEVAPVVTVPAPVDGTSPEAKSKTHNMPLWIISILLAAIVALLVAMLVKPDSQVNEEDPDSENTPGITDEVFDMDVFTTAVVNIAKTLTPDEDIATNADVFVEKIGATKLQELVAKYGELPVQKAIAEFLAFTPEIKMNQYISNNGLAYNPNAAEEYYQLLEDAEKAYSEATGKNPNGALMSLEGYDTYKSNREAMKALIIESGDMALLNWYEVKTNGFDAMASQQTDTDAALAYKEEVKLELVTNTNGSIKLLELQLEQKVEGTDANTLKYTDAYKEFILNNYIYVVAN